MEEHVEVIYDRCLPAAKRNSNEIPDVNCLDWHPNPSRYGIGTTNVLACATSQGFLVYTSTTMGNDTWHNLYHRRLQNGREGLCVQWHPVNMKILVTGTGCSDTNDGGLVRVVERHGDEGPLRTKQIFGPAYSGSSVHSLAFNMTGTILVASIFRRGNDPLASLFIISFGVSHSARATQKIIHYPERCSSAVIALQLLLLSLFLQQMSL